LNDRHRGHKPRLIDPVLKRLECMDCGCSWDRGRTPPGPCPGGIGKAVDDLLAGHVSTPVLGVKPVRLHKGLYCGPTKHGG
jgi:hypothetical protein